MARRKKTQTAAPAAPVVKEETPMVEEETNVEATEEVVDAAPASEDAPVEDAGADEAPAEEPEVATEDPTEEEPEAEEVADAISEEPVEAPVDETKDMTQLEKDLAAYVEVCDKITRGISADLARSRANRLNMLLTNVIKAKEFDALVKVMRADATKEYFSERRALIGLQYADRRLSDRISTMYNLFNAVATKMEIAFNHDVVAKHLPGLDVVDFTAWVTKKLG